MESRSPMCPFHQVSEKHSDSNFMSFVIHFSLPRCKKAQTRPIYKHLQFPRKVNIPEKTTPAFRYTTAHACDDGHTRHGVPTSHDNRNFDFLSICLATRQRTEGAERYCILGQPARAKRQTLQFSRNRALGHYK